MHDKQIYEQLKGIARMVSINPSDYGPTRLKALIRAIDQAYEVKGKDKPSSFLALQKRFG